MRLPDGEHSLTPGTKYDFTESQAEKLLGKAQGKVRVVKTNWLEAWEELAQATNNIERTDPRFQPVLNALEECDEAFEQGDWIQFRQAAEMVQKLVKEQKR